MAELLKERYNRDYVSRIAAVVKKHHRHFDQQAFISAVLDTQWPERELKARMGHIRLCLHTHLQLPFPEAVKVLCNAAPDFGGYEAMFFPEYIEIYGRDNWDISLTALAHMTCYSSSEFAVRPFIMADPERMMQQHYTWSKDPNHHIRRLASEGCRPRLPWAPALPDFKSDPSPILPVLEQLQRDTSDYVRRSVANNLNDIAKDNPQITVQWAQQHKGLHPHTDWIIKHGCRTLLKQAQPEVMALFGYPPAEQVEVAQLQLASSELCVGDELGFSFTLKTSAAALGQLRLEYAIDFLKANGKHSCKVFKISEGDLSESERRVQGKQSFRPMTTRKYYPGEHWLSIRVNGCEKARQRFNLKLD